MASTRTEAVLRSKYEDGISDGLRRTESLLQNTFSTMQNAGLLLGNTFERTFDGVLGWLQNLRLKLSQAADQSDSEFKRIGLGAVAMGLAVVAAAATGAKAFAGWLLDLAKRTSEITELKLSFESLTGSMEKATDDLRRLKQATEGQVGSADLLKNANRVLQSGIALSMDQYVRLTENVSRLAKSSGVDLTLALNTMTDALVRGNARGFQSIGIAISVRDAISQLAEASGQQANKIEDSGRRQAFYNELLEKTDAAVKRLPPEFISVHDAMVRGEGTWSDFFMALGEGVNRSGVLQEILRRLVDWMVGSGGVNVREFSLTVNQFIISMLKGFADFMVVLGVFSTLWDTVWGATKAVVYSAGSMIASTLYLIQLALVKVFEAAALMPGVSGQIFRSLLPSMREAAGWLGKAVETYTAGFKNSFSGFDEGRVKANAMAESARKLADDLEKFSGVVIQGANGLRAQGMAAGGAAIDQAKLNEQLQKYNNLLREIALRNASPEEKAAAQFTADWEKIQQLQGVTAEQRAELERLAGDAYISVLREIDVKAEEEAQKHQQELLKMEAEYNQRRAKQMLDFLKWMYAEPLKQQEEAERRARVEDQRRLSLSRTLGQAVDLSRQGQAPREFGIEAMSRIPQLTQEIQTRIEELRGQDVLSTQQLDDLFRLYDALDKLNRLNMGPFQAMTHQLRQDLTKMAQETTQAWGQLWEDLATGQENAGKKFLAALITTVANELMVLALEMTARAIWAAAMFDFIGAARYAAAAAGLAALSGVLKGIASNMAQTASAASSGSGDQGAAQSSSSSANQAPVYMVGAPGRAQTPGQVQQTPVGEVRVRVEPPQGWVVKQLDREYRGNNPQLRVILQNG
jgi:hypothetical protein